MSLQQMRQELRRKYERLRKGEEERRKAMLKYYERLAAEAPPWLPPLKREESRSNPALEVVDKSKAEYWIELLEEVIFTPGLDRTERARRSLNLFYEAAENLGYTEFAKFVRRWRELTASIAEPLTSSSHSSLTPEEVEVKIPYGRETMVGARISFLREILQGWEWNRERRLLISPNRKITIHAHFTEISEDLTPHRDEIMRQMPEIRSAFQRIPAGYFVEETALPLFKELAKPYADVLDRFGMG